MIPSKTTVWKTESERVKESNDSRKLVGFSFFFFGGGVDFCCE
jgi:hypothetical protein